MIKTATLTCEKCRVRIEAHPVVIAQAKKMGGMCAKCNPDLYKINGHREPVVDVKRTPAIIEEDKEMAKKKREPAITTPQKKHGPDGIEFIHVPDSVKIAKNARGEISWDVKVYYDSQGGTASHTTALNHLIDVHNDLVVSFSMEGKARKKKKKEKR